jgi:spore coat protein U-like protein
MRIHWISAGGVLTLVVMAVVTPASLRAQSASAQVKVTTTVVKRCTVTSTDVAFGSYDPVAANSTAPLDGTGSLVVTCTRGTPATIGIDAGTNGSRRMTNGTASFLTYELYKDTGRTQVWGDTGAAAATVPPAPSIAPRTITVYGRVPQTQDVTPGSYLDQVVATINF